MRRALKRALSKNPTTVRERLRIARAYRLLGESEGAARWYRPVVEELANKGEPLKAIAIAAELVRAAPQHRGVLDALATRYAAGRREAARVAVPLPPAPRQEPADAVSISKVYKLEDLGIVVEPDEVTEETPIPVKSPRLPREMPALDLDVAPEGAAVTSRLSDDAAERLSRVPLFSDLGKKAFVALAGSARNRILKPGEYLFREGEPALSFFIVVDGELEGVRRFPDREVILSRLRPGDVVGVFGLFSGRKRAASVRAHTASAVLEVKDTVLSEIVKNNPSARPALRRFYQDRLVLSFLGSSPLFCDLDHEVRESLVSQFKERVVPDGETLVALGEVTNGLFLIIKGSVLISRRSGGARVEEIAKLGRGHFFGVVAALAGRPTLATAVARGETTLAGLSHRAFNDFVREHPELRHLPSRLEQHGLMVSKEFFVGVAGIPGFAA